MTAEKITLTDQEQRYLRTGHNYSPQYIEDLLNSGDYGRLMCADTEEDLREATLAEARESLQSGPSGVFRTAAGEARYVSFG